MRNKGAKLCAAHWLQCLGVGLALLGAGKPSLPSWVAGMGFGMLIMILLEAR